MSYLVNPYMVTAGETIIFEQLTDSGNMYNIESINLACGMAVKSGSSLIGQSLNKISFALSYQNGFPIASTLYARVYNTGITFDAAGKHEFGSKATNTLTETSTVYPFQSGSSYTLVANDVLCIYADNSSASYPNNMILQGGRSGYSTSTLKFGDYNSTSWSSTGNQLPYIILAEA